MQPELRGMNKGKKTFFFFFLSTCSSVPDILYMVVHELPSNDPMGMGFSSPLVGKPCTVQSPFKTEISKSKKTDLLRYRIPKPGSF